MLTVQYGNLCRQVREPSGWHQMLLTRFRRTQVLTKLYDPTSQEISNFYTDLHYHKNGFLTVSIRVCYKNIRCP